MITTRWSHWVRVAPGRWLTFIGELWLPITVASLTLLSLLTLESTLDAPSGQRVDFRVYEDTSAELSPMEALKRAGSQPLVAAMPTYRSEAPFWALVSLENSHARYVAFGSRHARRIACWDTSKWQRLGYADRDSGIGAVHESGEGFVLDTLSPDPPQEVLCRLVHAGPASLSIGLRTASEQIRHDSAFYRASGLLEGSFVALALISVFVAFVLRERRYLMLSGWLLLSLRMAAITMGADHEWLGFSIPADQLSNVRKFTVTAYYLLTYALFTSIASVRRPWRIGIWMVWAGQVTPLLLIIAAFALPYEYYLPLMWSLVSFGVAVMTAYLVGALLVRPTRELGLYAAALFVVFAGSMGEVLAAAFNWRGLLVVLNSVTAAVSSSFLVSWALFAKIRSERASRQRADRELENVFSCTPIAMFTCDLDHRLVQANPAFERWFGPLDTTRGTTTLDEHLGVVRAEWDTDWHEGAFRVEGRDGVFFISQKERDGTIHGSIEDISELVTAQQRQHELASQDRLTGLLNRTAIDQAIEAMMSRDSSKEGLACLLYVNLERFRVLNQTFRHKAGDAVLVEVANRLRHVLQGRLGPVALGRIHADEFAAAFVAPDAFKLEGALSACLSTLNGSAYAYGLQVFDVRARGAVVELVPGYHAEDLFSLAKRAAGESSGSIHLQGASILQDYDAQGELAKQFSEPELPPGLMLYAQPILSLERPDQGLSFEILLRMQNSPGGQMVPIHRVIDAAEVGGNMPKLDAWVLRECLSTMAAHPGALKNTVFFGVNLSGASLNDESFIQEAYKILDEYPELVRKLSVEITESVAVSDYQHTNDFIQEMRSRGASVSLDDFGTGYTSYEYVLQLRTDSLKIDRSLISHLSDHPASAAVTGSIVDLATNLGMRTVAEGVETLEILALLRDLNASYAQGFLISRPMPLSDLLAFPTSLAAIPSDSVREAVLAILNDRAPSSLRH